MTKTNVIETILTTIPDATMVRTKSDFIAVPLEDGRFASVKVSILPNKEYTAKNGAFHAAYDHEAAVEAYNANQEAVAAKKAAADAERAAKPKKSTADPEKAAMRAARQASMMEYVATIAGVEFTATELVEALPDLYPKNDVLSAGSDLAAVARENTQLVNRKEKGKKYWTYNA